MAADRHGNGYVASSTTGSIWRIDRRTANVELWLQDTLLEGAPTASAAR